MKLFYFLLFIFSFSLASEDKVIFKGGDTPNDGGKSIDISWTINDAKILAETKRIHVFRQSETEEFKEIKKLDVSEEKFTDKQDIIDGLAYNYFFEFRTIDNELVYTSESVGPFSSKPQWIDKSKSVVFLFSIISIFIILLFINLAKKGKKLYVRPLPGVKAIEDAVGRATEMGKPCIYSPGISTISDIATLASLSILSKVSETIAEYNSRMIVPNFDPIVYSVTDEVIKSAYTKTGRPDAYRSEDVYFLSNRQFAYAAGISGLMAREKPAANFFLGWFMAESLILAEAGSMTGAIQIAGTDSISQIPFFIVACDYTLIGEELYAAGAYMGEDPKLIGGLKGQDYVKLVVMLTIAILFFLRIFGVKGVETILTGGK